jgi:hypothetical protein
MPAEGERKKISKKRERKEWKDLGHSFYRASDGEDSFMNTRNNFADTSFDACLFSQIGDIFASFSDDDAGVFCANERAESQGVLGRWRGRTRRDERC